MPRKLSFSAVLFTLALHALALAWAMGWVFKLSDSQPSPKTTVVYLNLLKPPDLPQREPIQRKPITAPTQQPAPALPPVTTTPAAPVTQLATPPNTPRATMAAPPPPTAEEWAFAAGYTNKNSKGYRYSWGQQVRSMMGTAVEGPDQGFVRFRIEIAPNGTLVQLQTLWTTSPVAEKLARQAIQNMPPLPPTPTGKPLVFEKTISFSPFASDGPPLYKDDCLPDPPVFSNPFAWDGKSPQVAQAPVQAAPPDPQALADCLRQLPKDSIEAESAHDRRLMEQWGSGRLKP
jgi:hypothetical protein